MSGGPFDRDRLVVGGRTLPMPAAEVRANVNRIFEDGRVLAVISEDTNGDVSVMVMGPPDLQLADKLEEAAKDLRTAILASRS